MIIKIEISIPWNDAVINENKYVLEPFKKEDRSSNTLADAWERKIEKYKSIIEEAEGWLQANHEDICIKHKVASVSVVWIYVIISSVSVVQDLVPAVWEFFYTIKLLSSMIFTTSRQGFLNEHLYNFQSN
jgi:hypothetical protein